MHVVATAGHVDHGKSTLVRALTGMEPDRWAEERRRGMTIDLGFAWTVLPSGATVAFVDVPGHERFVPNMLAGVGPVPAALMVVAADEGWMPQSAEHLDVLNALGVRHGLLVITRSDLMDPELALADAREHLLGTSMQAVVAVCVSGATGAGLDELRTGIDDVVRTLPQPDPGADVRLWIDRVFTIRGAGTVVTGTLAAGTLKVGDALQLATDGRRVTVRGLQSLGQPAKRLSAVARVAVNLRGVDHDELSRGDALLSPGSWRCTSTADVRLEDADVPSRAVLHIGSAAVPVRVRGLGADTARLSLAVSLPLRIGDRGVLRDPGANHVLGGATVLDPLPSAFTRRGAAAVRSGVLDKLDGVPDGAAELARRGVMRASELQAIGAQIPSGVARQGDWLLDGAAAHARAAELTTAVRAHAEQHPLEPGMPREAARQAARLPDVRLLDILLADPAASTLTSTDGRLYAGGDGSTAELPAALLLAVDQITARLTRQPFAAPEADELAALNLGPKELAAAVRAGLLRKVAEGIYLLPTCVPQAVALLAELAAPFTLSQARQTLGTTRRVAVPLMELLARERGAQRNADGTHELAAHTARRRAQA